MSMRSHSAARTAATIDQTATHDTDRPDATDDDSIEDNVLLFRPTAAYLLRHAGPGVDALTDAPPGSARADWIDRAFWREQTTHWLRLHAKLYTGRGDERTAYDAAQEAHAAYQRAIVADLAARGIAVLGSDQVIVSGDTVRWWRDNYGLVQFDGALYRPCVPLADVPACVLDQTETWWRPLGPYPPAGVPSAETAAREDHTETPAKPARSTTPAHPPTAIVPLFASGSMALIPSDKYTRAITSGVRGVEPFVPSDSGLPMVTLSEKDIDTTLTIRYLPEQTQLTDDEIAMCWTVAQELGDQEADYLRLALALYASTPARLRDADGYICVPIDVFLDMRGIRRIGDGKPGLGWHRSEEREQGATRFRRLAMLRAEVIDRREAKALIRETSVLLVDIWKTPDGRTPTHILYKPGRWRDESDSLLRSPQLALTNQWVYRFDPHNEKWEKRIAEYLTDALRMSNARSLTREISEILEATGLIQFHDTHNPKTTRARFEKALQTIVLPDKRRPDSAIIGAWAYADPGRLAKLPKYGWFNPWMRLRVAIQATPHTAACNHERAAKKAQHALAPAPPARKRGRPRKRQPEGQGRLPHLDDKAAV